MQPEKEVMNSQLASWSLSKVMLTTDCDSVGQQQALGTDKAQAMVPPIPPHTQHLEKPPQTTLYCKAVGGLPHLQTDSNTMFSLCRQVCLQEHTYGYEILPLYSCEHQSNTKAVNTKGCVEELSLHSDNWHRCDTPHVSRHPEVEL